jgi:hypothetical protein
MAKRRKRAAPYDPAEAARHAAERERHTRRTPALWGPNEEALSLPQNADVATTQKETRSKTRRVERFDCFATLKLEDATLTAVRRYQVDIAISYRADGKERIEGYVDGAKGSAEHVNARSMDATRRLDEVEARLRDHDVTLLRKLSIPTHVNGQQLNWHAEIKTLRGLIDRGAQTKAVKDAAGALRDAYAEIDNGVRVAA